MKKIFICVFLSVLLGIGALSYDIKTKETKTNVNKKEDAKSRLDSLQKLTKIIGTVEKYYVDDLELQEIVDKALKGLMAELDAHSSYLDKKYFKEMKIQTDGEFGGLGITVGMKDKALVVIAPIEDTPADKAGIKSGDIILKIDEQSTLNMALDEAVSLMRGKPKTPIVLTIVRYGQRKPLEIKIIRDIIKIKSVYSKKIGEDLLYLRVTSFDKNVADSLEKIIKDGKVWTKGIVLDLRNNPGGLLTQAIDVSDFFIDKGVIVSQKGRSKEMEEEFKANSFSTLSKVPLVVLVNSGSASASEIVAGALQDHKRAIIVGEKTFGKGSVQVVLPVTEDKEEGIKLTIAKYYLPSGRTIQAKGITPDIIAYAGKAVDEPNGSFKIKEADLKKHLEAELTKIDKKSANKENDKKEEKDKDKKESDVISTKDLQKDNQLRTATDILRSLVILRK